MTTSFSMNDLLEYNAIYGVLICRECKYAIQKSALASHLLRHKIYRGERQRLLSSIAHHELLEPDDVQLPPAGSPPVDGLPINPGFRCAATDCDRLYASQKRMRRHWAESHGMSDPPESFAHPVNLQTFFRGTKIRYFEVASHAPMTTDEDAATFDEENSVERQSLGRLASPAPRADLSILPGISCNADDMEMLRYFHHFTSTTSLSLPAQKDFARYWQTDAVTRALRSRWMMCGLLAISASHMAALSEDNTALQAHQERSTQFVQEFSAGWEKIKRDSNVSRVEEAKMGAQIRCIHRCFQWLPESESLGLLENLPLDWRSFAATIQGCVDPDFALRSALAAEDMLEEAFVPSRDDLETGENLEGEVLLPGNIPPTLLAHLRTLPYRMAEPLGRPDSALDVFAALAAIESLIECCSISYASENVVSVWRGMESWLRKVPDHFSRMAWRGSSGALVVVAHWTFLIRRAEFHCWFLRGAAAKVVRQVVDELPEDTAIRDLVSGIQYN